MAAESTESARGTRDRGKEAGSRVDLVRLQKGGPKALVKVPREELVLDEVAIAPSRNWQTQEQAETVLAKAAKGQHFKDDYLQRLQRELRKTGDQKNSDLANGVGALRASQAGKDAARLIAPVNRGTEVSSEAAAGKAADPDEDFGDFSLDEAGWDAFLADLGYEGKEAQARGVADRFAHGGKVTLREARRSAGLLTDMRRRALQGKEDAALPEFIKFLIDFQGSQIRKDVGAVKDAERTGRRAREGYRDYLQQTALGWERQSQLLGNEADVGVGLALELGEIKRARVQEKIKVVLSRGKTGEAFGEAYLRYLAESELGMARQDELLGQGSAEGALEVASELSKIRRLSFETEAADVLARSQSGERFDDSYIDYLRRRLMEDEAGRSGSDRSRLAQALGALQRSWLVAEATDVLARARNGERFSDTELDYLQRRLLDLESQKYGGIGADGSSLARALSELME